MSNVQNSFTISGYRIKFIMNSGEEHFHTVHHEDGDVSTFNEFEFSCAVDEVVVNDILSQKNSNDFGFVTIHDSRRGHATEGLTKRIRSSFIESYHVDKLWVYKNGKTDPVLVEQSNIRR